MNNIIKEINNIEELANKIVEDAINKKKSMAEDLDNILLELDEKSKLDTQASVDSIRSSTDANLKQKTDALKEDFDKRTLALDKEYNTNKQKYSEEIFKHIIGE